MRCPECGSHMDMEEGVGFVCAHCGIEDSGDLIGRSNSRIMVIENWKTSCIGCGKILRVEKRQTIGDDPEDPVVIHNDVRYGCCPGCGVDVDQIVLRGAA